MVWWSNQPDARLVRNARTHEQTCTNCDNWTEHVLFQVKGGVGFGNPLTGKMWVSTRTDWALVCPICESGDPIDKLFAQELQEPAHDRSTAGFGAPPAGQADTADSSTACQSCGEPTGPAAKFCGSCGHRVAQAD
jgi:hypothetical protein